MDSNPCTPPSPEHEPRGLPMPEEALPLATLGQRFVASLLDSLIVFGPLITASIWAPIPFLNELWQDESPSGEAFFSLLGFLIFLVLNFRLIQTRDQTIGKLALGIKVNSLNGKSPSKLTQAGLRYGYFYLIDALPVVGTFISVIGLTFILGRDRRSLHDYLAGTKVVQCRSVKSDF